MPNNLVSSKKYTYGKEGSAHRRVSILFNLSDSDDNSEAYTI